MSQDHPRRRGFGAALAAGAGVIVGLVGGCMGCMAIVTVADRLRIPPLGFVALGVLLVVTPLLVLLSRRRPGESFAVGILIGLCLTGLLLGACGTLMMN